MQRVLSFRLGYRLLTASQKNKNIISKEIEEQWLQYSKTQSTLINLLDNYGIATNQYQDEGKQQRDAVLRLVGLKNPIEYTDESPKSEKTIIDDLEKSNTIVPAKEINTKDDTTSNINTNSNESKYFKHISENKNTDKDNLNSRDDIPGECEKIFQYNSSAVALSTPQPLSTENRDLMSENSLDTDNMTSEEFENNISNMDISKIPGSSDKDVFLLRFTCAKCDTTSTRKIGQQAYNKGVVIVQCPKCKNRHLIADNLGWFEDNKINVETMGLAKKQSLYTAKLVADNS